MTVIDKGGKRTRVRCGYCPAMVEVKTNREKKCGSACRNCLDGVLAEIVADYREQVDRGVPMEMRTALSPVANCVPLGFVDEIRASLIAVDPLRPKLICAEKREKTA